MPKRPARPARHAEHDEDEDADEPGAVERESEEETEERVAGLMGDVTDVPADWLDLVESRVSALAGEGRSKGAEDRKTMDEVFDRQTLLVLWKFISNGLVATVDYPLSTGKEANVFHGTTRDGGSLAVKIFRTNTATFRSHLTYIHGDPRFGKIGRDLRDIVHVWASKEYKNLQRYFEGGVKVPQPIAYRQNVLVMDFIGTNGAPAPLLKDAPPEDPDAAYATIVADYRRGLTAGLVHGDLSEFNVLNHEGELYIIDVAQAVLTRHPMARELLDRDARNVARYFARLGVRTDAAATKKAMTPEKAKEEAAVSEDSR